MECACISVDYDDFDERIDYIRNKEVTASKDFKCVECGCTISKDSKVEVVIMGQLKSGKYDHYFTCEDCLSMRIGLFCSYYIGMIWDTLYEEIDSADGAIKFDALPKMTKIARDKVCDLLEEYYFRQYGDGLICDEDGNIVGEVNESI